MVGRGVAGMMRWEERACFEWQGVVGVLVLGWGWAVQVGRGFVVCRKCGGEEGEGEGEGGCYVGHWLRSDVEVFGFQGC